MRSVLIFILLFFSLTVIGQGTVGYLFEDYTTGASSRTIKDHTSLRPHIRMKAESDSSYLSITGLSDLNYIQSNKAQYKLGLGAEFSGLIKNKLYFRLAGVQGIYDTDKLYEPKSYINSIGKSVNSYTDIRSRISYTPNHIFNFQIGLDHNFIGEGCRSMLLSDYGIPYPFAAIRTRFWRMEYSMLYQFMKERDANAWEGKFNAAHHISFNAAKWMNIGIFESVTFQPRDTLINRGFEVEYLNPMVFYRPQEYALGSSDNVLIGAEMSFFYKSHTLYAQFLIDEFNLDSLKAKNGWWANKFGGQLGVKGTFDLAGQEFFYRLEYNFARPYTYSHLSEELNYGNQGYNLAHPYGANFMEVLGELKWQKEKWKAKLFLSYYLKGEDKDGYSYGGNTYLPYTSRPYNIGHHIGQGVQRNGVVSNLTLSYEIVDHGKLSAFSQNQLRYVVQTNEFKPVLIVGIRSLLWNDYRNY